MIATHFTDTKAHNLGKLLDVRKCTQTYTASQPVKEQTYRTPRGQEVNNYFLRNYQKGHS